MADTAVAITAGTGTNIDTRTEATNGNHRQVVVVGDPSTNAGVAPVDATNGLSVTLTTAIPAGTNNIGDVDVLSVVAGTGATNLGKAEDAVHASGDTGVMALAVRADTAAATGANGDYVPLLTDANGRLHTHAVASGVNADDSSSVSSPVVMGGVAVETDGTDPTSVSAEGDTAHFRTDRNRRLLVSDIHPNLWSATELESSAATNDEIKAAAGAGLSLYITDVIVSNGATAGKIKFVEDTAGTPVTRIEEINLAVNGGCHLKFQTPLRISTNKNFGYTSTTMTNHSVTVSGFIAP